MTVDDALFSNYKYIKPPVYTIDDSVLENRSDGVYVHCSIKASNFTIKNVIFNGPATIVFWADGEKTVVKCSENDVYDPEKGLAMAIAKRALGNKGKYYDIFKKWMPEEDSICNNDLCDITYTWVPDELETVIEDFKNCEQEE